jgi:hypothetical protein
MFPTLSEYNKTIQVQGANAFRTLNNIYFIPARTTPIKIYSFGSGSFAVVFKALENNKEIAIRCFIGTDIDYVERYRKIDNYLKTIKENWKTNIEFLENEIEINGKLFPVVKMDWVEGKLLDRFLNSNLQNNEILSELQKQIFKTSKNLEKNKIAHGDIQCGNIIIKEVNGKPQIKLIDYDGMYIPDFQGEKQIERGRSEFQHPNRNSFEFNEKIDRFSFWIILCSLEALKFDKTLWKEIMQGGFNTLDNLLFVANDFSNPNQSKLFNRLERLNQPSLNFYLDKLKFALYNSTIDKVQLFEENESLEPNILKNFKINTDYKTQNQFARLKITSSPSGASVRNNNFASIGITPLTLNKYDYINHEIKIIFGTKSKSIIIDELANDINVDFDKIIVSKQKIEKEEPIVTPLIEQKPTSESNPIIWIGLILLFIIIIGVIITESSKNNYNNNYPEEAIVDTTAVAVDTFAVAVDSSASFIDTDTIPTLVQEQVVDSAAATTENRFNNSSNEEFIQNLNVFNGGYIIDKIVEFTYDKNSSQWLLDNTLNYGELNLNNLILSFKKPSMDRWKYIKMEYQEFDFKNKCFVLKDNYNQLILIDENFRKITFFSNVNNANNYENAYIYYILRKSEFVKPN